MEVISVRCDGPGKMKLHIAIYVLLKCVYISIQHRKRASETADIANILYAGLWLESRMKA